MKSKLIISIFISVTLLNQLSKAQDTTGSAISPQEFRKQMKKKNTGVVDVRTNEEYKTGFIGKAINYNVMDSVAFVNSISSLDKNKKYLLYCHSGRRSGKALVIMKNMGFLNVQHLQGGITGWKAKLKKP